jgi:CDP-4-dehydro-6-deoxyglucose reductase, E1
MIPLMKNTFINEYETKQALVNFIIKCDKFSMGDMCFEFEKQFAQKQGSEDAILFNSGGSANLAIMQMLKNLGLLKDGDNVGFSALTWSTNVMPILQMGFNPIPIDCDPKTLNTMSKNLEMCIDKYDLKCFFITNALGFCGDLRKIRTLCNNYGVLLIEDNCEALGTILESGNKTGNYGVVSSFSFYVGHHMSTIEGGMVCTSNKKISEMLRIVRANGWDRNLSYDQQVSLRKKHNIISEFNAKYIFYDLGFNLRPTEITGFLGLNQLQHLDKNIKRRQDIYTIFENVLKTNNELYCIDHSHIQYLSPFSLPILCRTPKLRKKYVDIFLNHNIEIRPVIAGNMQKQPFFKKYISEIYDLPGVDFIHNNGFYCGINSEMSNSDIEIIKSCLRGEI